MKRTDKRLTKNTQEAGVKYGFLEHGWLEKEYRWIVGNGTGQDIVDWFAACVLLIPSSVGLDSDYINMQT